MNWRQIIFILQVLLLVFVFALFIRVAIKELRKPYSKKREELIRKYDMVGLRLIPPLFVLCYVLILIGVWVVADFETLASIFVDRGMSKGNIAIIFIAFMGSIKSSLWISRLRLYKEKRELKELHKEPEEDL